MKDLFVVVWRLVMAVIFFMGFVYLMIRLNAAPYIEDKASLPHVHTAIVLGAGLSESGLSDILKDRLDTSIELYDAKKVDVILVSGDNGSLAHNEVNPSRDYLLANDIPTEDIFLDHAGFDTYSSMYRASSTFLVDKAIIVTQSFHLPRAVFIARHLGIEAYGVASDRRQYSIKNYIREFFADVKAVLDTIYKRTPKYFGDEIPITGDSSSTI